MARVPATVEEIELEGDHGPVAGLLVTCTRCDHAVEVFGVSGASARRGAVMLAEECPEGGRNFYVLESDEVDLDE